MATISLGGTTESRPYASLSELKPYLEIMTTDIQDDYLKTLLDDASALVDSYVGRPLRLDTYLDTQSVGWNEPCDTLTLRHRPVVQIESIKRNGEDVDFPNGITADPTLGFIRPPQPFGRFWQPGHYTTIYIAGFVVAPGLPSDTNDGAEFMVTVPRAVARATLIVAADLFRSRSRDMRVRSETAQGLGSTAWLDPQPGNGGMPTEACDLLQPWVSLRVA